MTDGGSRELTREERAAIRKLVVSMCANFDRDYGCLPLDCECYMLGKCWTGAYCKYFRNAVLPLSPILTASLTGEVMAAVYVRSCLSCGKVFPLSSNRGLYCPDCAARARKRRQREYMRQKRR
jgi:hypothetical protein